MRSETSPSRRLGLYLRNHASVISRSAAPGCIPGYTRPLTMPGCAVYLRQHAENRRAVAKAAGAKRITAFPQPFRPARIAPPFAWLAPPAALLRSPSLSSRLSDPRLPPPSGPHPGQDACVLERLDGLRDGRESAVGGLGDRLVGGETEPAF